MSENIVPNAGEKEPKRVVLLTAIGVAALLGMSRQNVSIMQRHGKLPQPVAWVNDSRPAWLPAQFTEPSDLPTSPLDLGADLANPESVFSDVIGTACSLPLRASADSDRPEGAG